MQRAICILLAVTLALPPSAFAGAASPVSRQPESSGLPRARPHVAVGDVAHDSASRVVGVAFGDGRSDTSYVIDGVGNWVSRTEGGETRTTNARQNGRYAADLMNEVQRVATFNALGALVSDEQQTQDPNGNRIASGEFRLTFDAFDRLVRVVRNSDGQTVGRYRYDAAGRRVDRWFVPKGEVVAAAQQVYHVHDGAQEVEELGASGAVQADFVWGGLYVDHLVQMRRGGQEYFFHSNSTFSVVAATRPDGSVAERYSYSSIYGVCAVKDGAGAPQVAEIGNPWRFQGRRFDPETGFYYFRLRYLDPGAGRWVTRDPLGIWGDPGQLGNAYSFCGNDPVNGVDPWGLWTLRLDQPNASDPSTWQLKAVPEAGDTMGDLWRQIDPNTQHADADQAATGEVDISDVIPGMRAALSGVPIIRQGGSVHQPENCYSFALAIKRAGWTRSVYYFDTTRLPSGKTATVGPRPGLPGGGTLEGRSQQEIEAALDNLVNPGGNIDNPLTGQPLGPVTVPATGTFFNRADMLTLKGQLRPGDILGLYAGQELVHVTTVVLVDRSGMPWLIEKPNPVDPTQVTPLSTYFGPGVPPWGTEAGPSPTTSVKIWRPAAQ